MFDLLLGGNFERISVFFLNCPVFFLNSGKGDKGDQHLHRHSLAHCFASGSFSLATRGLKEWIFSNQRHEGTASFQTSRQNHVSKKKLHLLENQLSSEFVSGIERVLASRGQMRD